MPVMRWAAKSKGEGSVTAFARGGYASLSQDEDSIFRETCRLLNDVS